jgi:hypothetical protein
MKVNVLLRAIRKQARRIKDGRSHLEVSQHADAIIALANIGSELVVDRVALDRRAAEKLACKTW